MTVRERYELKRKDMSERINLCNREDRLLVLFVERVVFLSWIIWISGRELKNTRGGSFAPLFFIVIFRSLRQHREMCWH